MAGTKAGGQKTRDKNLANDPNYFVNLGKLGGKASNTGGWAYMAKNNPERLSEIGKKGGAAGRKRKNV